MVDNQSDFKNEAMHAPECGKLIKNSQKMLLALMKMFAAFFNQQSWFPNAKGNVFKVFILRCLL